MYPYNEFLMNILNDINTMSFPIKSNSNTIELTVHISCYWVLDLLCVNIKAMDIPSAQPNQLPPYFWKI